MSYRLPTADDLKQKVSDAISDLMEFNSKTTPRLKEQAKWRIYTALVDCSGFINRTMSEKSGNNRRSGQCSSE